MDVDQNSSSLDLELALSKQPVLSSCSNSKWPLDCRTGEEDSQSPSRRWLGMSCQKTCLGWTYFLWPDSPGWSRLGLTHLLRQRRIAENWVSLSFGKCWLESVESFQSLNSQCCRCLWLTFVCWSRFQTWRMEQIFGWSSLSLWGPCRKKMSDDTGS